MDVGKNADRTAYRDRQLALKVRNLLWKASANQDERALLIQDDTASAQPPLPFLYQG
jgi:hypothetical protein